MSKPSKRGLLLEATKELLWELGFESMSPRDIQERSAARPGSLYHHFPSKLALAGEAMSEAAREDIAKVDEFFAGNAPPLDMVERYLQLERETLRGCKYGRLVNEASIAHDELRRPVTDIFDTIRRNLTEKLSQAKTEGTLSQHIDPEKLAIMLLAMIQGGTILARSYQDEALAKQAVEGAISLLTEATHQV